MPTKTSSSRPSAHRSSTSHGHHISKPSSTPSGTRIPSSVGSSMPPVLNVVRSPDTRSDGSRFAALRSPGIQHEQHAPRTPSPNYFGLTVEPSESTAKSALGPASNWSPPTSSIRSFNPQSPQHIPVDSNPAFEAFKRQAEINQGFSLGHGNLSQFATTPGILHEKKLHRRESAQSPKRQAADKSASKPDADESDSAYFSSESKRQSKTSNMSAPSFFDVPRQESPAAISRSAATPNAHIQQPQSNLQRNFLSHLDDRHPRLSLPLNKADPPSPGRKNRDVHRADTLPNSLEVGPTFITASQLKQMLGDLAASQFLLLDLRVAPQYSQYRIKGALNLCIPTTLLKRPSFNIHKLTETFKIEEEKERFAKWQSCEFIVVYDARSSEKKDALSAVNTLRKFENEGWRGQSLILRGGIEGFRKAYPTMIDNRSSHEMHSGDEVLPVAGGCVMPEAENNGANPFFSNIRQNMDLIGGVGQIQLKLPEDSSQSIDSALPAWLRKASSATDRGKAVSDKFLHIEQDELARMQKALSSRVSYGTPQANGERNVQIAGFEKGQKNRYNNIWPFEHSRVHLKGKESTECDYVNASHIKAAWSNKRYIASQGPLPATFGDFWSVVWDQDVRVIVMLTAESEGGQLKCHPYWESKEYGNFKLKGLSEKRVSLDPNKHRRSSGKHFAEAGRRRANTTSQADSVSDDSKDMPYVVVRKFTLAHTSEPFKPMREITQLHYSSWPDFGAPAQPSHLLGLIELSNSMQRGSLSPSIHVRADEPEPAEASRPMLVHCSAGCGRTGTFCTVDSVIDMLKRQRKEQSSGVTPMETEQPSDTDASYWSRGRKPSANHDDDWIFNQEVDLVEKTVEDFRKQRISMVQSLIQYVLCYETVLEWVSQQRSGGSRPQNSARDRSGSEPRS